MSSALSSLVNYFLANIFKFTVTFSLLAILWYYRYVFRPYAKFPYRRLEYRIAYWILRRKPVNVEIFRSLVELSKKHATAGMFVIWIGRPWLFIFDEEVVKHIVQDPSLTSRPFQYKLMEFSMGNGLLTSSGDLWKKRVKSITPAFYVKALKTYVSVMNKNAKGLVDRLSETRKEPIDNINYILALCTLKLLYESSIGVPEGDEKDEVKTVKRIQKVYGFLVHRIVTPWLHFESALNIFPYARKIVKTDAKLKKKYRQMLEKIKEELCNRDKSQSKIDEEDDLEIKTKSIGEIIVEDHLTLPDVSMQDLADEISFLIAAGFDTSAHTLMWCFFSLGHEQDIQQRLYEEISTVTNENVQYKDVQDLIYLDCVIKETLRFYSVVPIFGRRLDEDLKCGKHFIPKNTDVAIFSYALHKNPTIYPNPGKFDPDRFLEADSKIKPWNFIPFAEGNRPCLGKKFALLSIKIIMIHVLRHFKIVSLDRMEDMQFKWALVLTSEEKPRMKFVPRC